MDEIIVPQADLQIRVVRFWTKYFPEPGGGMRGVDWVEYAPRGMAKFTITPEAIPRLQKATDGKWQAIQPAYEAWKKGHEMPAQGTPLAAWSGVSPEQAEVLRFHDCRTVEEVAAMTDAQMQAVGLPGLRSIRDAAKAWHSAKDSRRFEAAMAEKDERIAALEAQMQDLIGRLKDDLEDKAFRDAAPRPSRLEVRAARRQRNARRSTMPKDAS